MKRNFIFLPTLLALFLPACGAAIPEIAPDVAVDPPPDEVAFVAAEPSPPPTATATPLPPTPTSEPIPAATELDNTPTPQPEPTAIDIPTPEPDWLNNYGRTADKLVYLGNPDAPVMMIDFSDFM